MRYLILYIITFFITLSTTKLDRTRIEFLPYYFILLSIFILVFFKGKNYDRKTIWIVNISLRIVILFIPIGLSDDIYRYVWDAHVQKNGINPYLYAPDSIELSHIRTGYWSNINNPLVQTPYPPMAQILFFTFFANSLSFNLQVVIFRIFIMVIDLLVIYVLEILLNKMGKPLRNIILYAWHPLVLVEFTGNAHFDVLALLFMLLSILYFISSRYTLSSIFITIAVLIKIFPIFVIGFYIHKLKIKDYMTIISISLLLNIMYYTGGIIPIYSPGQQTFVKYFSFNTSSYRLLELLPLEPLEIRLTYALIMVAIGLILLYRYYRNCNHETMIGSITWLYLISLLLGPENHPWYALWFLPLAIISMNKVAITLSLTIALSYEIYLNNAIDGSFNENTMIIFFEYILVYILLILDFVRKDFLISNTKL